jgi:DNA mismatch repair ATPase MutS
MFMGQLRALRAVADAQAARFTSAGFTRFFRMLSDELDDSFFGDVDRHLAELRFRGGVLISARLGRGAKGRSHVLRKAPEQSWIERVAGRTPGYSFQLADRDENGFKALGELKGQGMNLAANALAQSADHILAFFRMLRCELAFYVGCGNLHQRLAAMGEPASFPVPVVEGKSVLAARGLYDPCLALQAGERVVGNDVDADGKRLIIVTGANQGGKSTFLRSVGVAQLMMQCGMFTPAAGFRADVSSGVFTHFKREEDAAMEGGKLDEELRRMSGIVARITPGALLLGNESFASTNEREGSRIARQILRALLDRGVRVVFVTHLHDLAERYYQERLADVLFLRAQRLPDGARTFRQAEGQPEPTSHG